MNAPADSANVELEFVPVPSVAKLFQAKPDLHRFIFVLGPIGSTKTTSVLFFLLMKAASQEPSPDGLRRTRFAIVRSTLTSLINTVLKDILNLFGSVAEWRPSTRTVHIRVGDILSEWMLMPLDTPHDQKRLLSLQLSGVFVNEAREVSWDLIQQAFSRTGRFPSQKAGGVTCTHRFIVCDSNLGVEGSAMYNFLEKQQDPKTLYIHQPDALSEQADWLQYLPEGYYADLMIGASVQWIRQHIKSQWGQDLSGEPVYGESFAPLLHVSQHRLKSFPDRPLLIGIDPGLNPAVVVTQLAPNGQLWALREIHAPNLLLMDFLGRIVTPTLQQLYPLHRMLFVMDPTGDSRTALAPTTSLGTLRGLGYTVVLASTNEIAPRIRSVERWLGNMVGDRPALLIDPRCEVLVNGFNGQYRYLRDSKGELNPKPEKKHPVSDVHDCLQYVCLALAGRRGTRLATNTINTGLAQAQTTSAPWRGK